MSTEGILILPIKITPEAPRAVPEVKTPVIRPEPEAKPPVQAKPAVYTRKQKRAVRKPDIVYTEYGRTVVKKAKSGTIRLTDADMEADELLDVGNIADVGKK